MHTHIHGQRAHMYCPIVRIKLSETNESKENGVKVRDAKNPIPDLSNGSIHTHTHSSSPYTSTSGESEGKKLSERNPSANAILYPLPIAIASICLLVGVLSGVLFAHPDLMPSSYFIVSISHRPFAFTMHIRVSLARPLAANVDNFRLVNFFFGSLLLCVRLFLLVGLCRDAIIIYASKGATVFRFISYASKIDGPTSAHAHTDHLTLTSIGCVVERKAKVLCLAIFVPFRVAVLSGLVSGCMFNGTDAI